MNKQELIDFIKEEIRKNELQLNISNDRLLKSYSKLKTEQEQQETNMVYYYQGTIDILKKIKLFIEHQMS